jgi:MFS family permease
MVTSRDVELPKGGVADVSRAADTTPDPASTRRAWTMVWALMVVLTLNIVDRQMIGLLGQPLSEDLGLSDSQLGILGGIGFAGVYALASVPWGWLADRPKVGRMAALSAALAIWSTATAVCGAAQNFTQILLGRMGVAAGEAGCMPAAQALIAEAVPRAKLARAMAIFGLGIPLGAFAGRAGGGFLADQYGWRNAFLLVGAPGVILAVVLMLVFRKPPRLTVIQAVKPSIRKALSQIFRSRTIIYLAVANIFTGALAAIIAFWGMVHYQRNLGLTAGEAGLYYGIQAGVTGVIGILIGGWVSDKLAQQRPRHYMTPALWGQLLAPPLLLAAWGSDLWWVALLFTTLPTMGDNLAYAGSAAATQRLLTSDVRASATSINALVVTLLGPGLGLTLFGVVSDLIRDHLPPGTPAAESVRYALMGAALLSVIPAFFFWLAGRSMEVELTRFESPEDE